MMAKLRASNRPHLIIVERFTETRDVLNTPIKVWNEHCKAYAAVYFGSGSEQREAAQTQGAQVASFEILSNANARAITVMDRISFAGGLWDIRSVAPIGLNEGVKINAVRAVP